MTPAPHRTVATDIALRPAVAADISALVNVINAAYRKSEGHVFPGSTRIQRAGMSDMLRELTVAETGGRIVGCVQITCARPAGHFGLLAVDVELHRKGIGSTLIAHAEQIARERACTLMQIEVVKEGGKIPYYEQRGYDVVREHDGQVWNGGADWGAAIPWHMVEMEKAIA